MARLHRQELKHDEFIDSVDAALLYLETHARSIISLILLALVGGGAVGGFYWYSRQQERQASVALANAMLTYQAQVLAGLPPLPGQEAERTFESEEAKFTAAEKEFAAVRDHHPRTRSGRVAQHYQALCLKELGRTDEAVKLLEELSRTRDKNVAALAKLTLAGFYEELGRVDDAARAYRELADNPAATVPRATALLELAALEAIRNPDEARKLYNQIKAEYPDSPIATQVNARLELLPAPTLPATPPAQP